MPKTKHISVVSPVYKAEQLVDSLVAQIILHVEKITIDFEIILVEDGSNDNSWEKIQQNCLKDSRVKGVKLSRNFGQHYAITAGLEASQGEWIIIMDCDLQDRPDQIPKLYEASQKGFDLVFARRILRQDVFFKRASSKVFYRLFSYLTETNQDSAISNFGVYNRKVVDAILSMEDQLKYFPTMSKWVGFSSTTVDVEHGKRESGASSYSWKALIELAFNNIIAFSDMPLKLTIKFGLLISTVSGMVGIYYLISYFLGNITVSGFASLIISIWFLSGIIIFILGMIGIYLGKVFEKVKGRPVYIIDKTINI